MLVKIRTFVTIIILAVISQTVFANTPGELLYIFENPSPDMGSSFGASVAAFGNKIAISAPFDSTLGWGSGRVYVFDSLSGNLLHTLESPSPTPEMDNFGTKIAVINNDVFVASNYRYSDSHSTGTVYRFDCDTGELKHTYQNPGDWYGKSGNQNSGDRFGHDIIAFGNDILISSFAVSQTGYESGAVYHYDGETGEIIRVIEHPNPVNPNSPDAFGASLSVIDGDILVGAARDSAVPESAGAAYLLDGETGNLLQSFYNPDPFMFDSYGEETVSLGQIIAIAEPGTGRGFVHLYDSQTGQLLNTLQSPRYNPPNNQNNDDFGSSMAAIGHHIYIGSYRSLKIKGEVFAYNGLTGEMLGGYQQPEPIEGDAFGLQVVSIGNNILISSVGYDDKCFEGDANCDAMVSDLDLNLLEQFFGQSQMDFSNGDFSGDDKVSLLDLDILGKNYGEDRRNSGRVYMYAGVEQTASVPEPASISILLTGIMLTISTKRRTN